MIIHVVGVGLTPVLRINTVFTRILVATIIKFGKNWCYYYSSATIIKYSSICHGEKSKTFQMDPKNGKIMLCSLDISSDLRSENILKCVHNFSCGSTMKIKKKFLNTSKHHLSFV